MKLINWSIISALILSAFTNNSEYFVKVSKQEATAMALQIRNFQSLGTAQKQSVSKEVFIWENTQAIAKINADNRLPHSLIHISTHPLEVNTIQPSPFEKRPVNWLPSLSLFYELMAVHDKMLQQYGNNACPSIYLVMALLSHETYMREIKGDNQLSVGMCQLYKPTAKYLVNASKNKEVFQNLIYFDDKGEHQFFSQKSMLEFIYHFLILEKGYTHHAPKKGIKSYNGTGKMADTYAKNVLLKSMFYEALTYKLKQSEPTLAINNLREWSKAPLTSTFIDFNGFHSIEGLTSNNKNKHLSSEEAENYQRLKFNIVQYVSEIEQPHKAQELFIEPKDELEIYLEKALDRTQITSPINGDMQKQNRKYFILEKNRSVYSYLRENTYKVLTTLNNYYFYTIENEEKKQLHSEKELENALSKERIILSTASVGDTIYFDNYPVFNLK